MKKLLSAVGLSVAVALIGLVVLVMICVLACVVYVWRNASTLPPVAADARPAPLAQASATEFDGPPWALGRYQARRRGALRDARQGRWLSVAAAEFDRVGPARTPFPAGALLCRVSMQPGVWDQTVAGATTAAAPDTSVTLRVGNAPLRDAHGPADQHEVTLAFPLAALPDGVDITLRAYDRDLSFHDEAGEATVRYDGHLPIRFTAARFSAECRGASSERVDALAAPAIAELDALINRFELPSLRSAFAPSHSGDDLWDADTRIARIQGGMFSLADWLGWAHPAMRRLLAAAEAVPHALPRQIAATLGALPRTPTTHRNDILVRLIRWDCGAAARGRCGVHDDQGCVAELALGRFDATQSEPIVPETSELFSAVARRRAVRFEALPRRRSAYCLAFDAVGAPTLLDGSAPAVLNLFGASALIRVQ